MDVEVSIFVNDKLSCQLFIEGDNKTMTLSEARDKLMGDVALPESFQFMKHVNAHGLKVPIGQLQEKSLILNKCLLQKDGHFSLYLQEFSKGIKQATNDKVSLWFEV